MSLNTPYGNCSYCDAALEPVWFDEEETQVTQSGHLVKTGRKRRACSHLFCPICGKTVVVDDTFDENWRR